MQTNLKVGILVGLIHLVVEASGASNTLVIASYNLENYLLQPTENRPAKSIAARDQVARVIASIRPDILAVQEIGPAGAIDDLQQRLQVAGWALPHAEWVGGWDTNIAVGLLSRHPFRARRSHTNDSFLLAGRRWHPSRGIAEVEVEPTRGVRFTVFNTHLKSKRPSAGVDEAELREAEARVVRTHVEAALRRNPEALLVVCGDFNDHKDSRPLRLLIGKGRGALVDTRPAERRGITLPSERSEPDLRKVVWTHFYPQEDSYARFDYLLISRATANRWLPAGSYIYDEPDWGLASDHRPVVCEFSLNE